MQRTVSTDYIAAPVVTGTHGTTGANKPDAAVVLLVTWPPGRECIHLVYTARSAIYWCGRLHWAPTVVPELDGRLGWPAGD